MHPIDSTLRALQVALLFVVSMAHSVADFFGETQPLPASVRRLRRRALDGNRLELRALRRRMRLSRSRVHRGGVRVPRVTGAPDQVHVLPEPPSPASVQRWLRRRWRRRFSATAGATLEIQLNRYGGDWEVLHQHQDQPLSLHTSKKRATSAARYRLRTDAGGEILILAHAGKVIKTVQVEPRRPFLAFARGSNIIISGRLVSDPSIKVEGPISGFRLRPGLDELRTSSYTATLKS